MAIFRYRPDMTHAQQIGAAIRARRISAGLTQEDVERSTGISQASLSAWERGENMGQMDRIEQVCAAIGLEPPTWGDPGAEVAPDVAELVELYAAASPMVRDLVRVMLRRAVEGAGEQGSARRASGGE